MLKALKENKEYKIAEEQKMFYLDAGYDIYEDGKIVEYSPKKKIEYGEYIKVEKENKKLKAENKKLKDAADVKLVDENAKLTSEIETLKKELEELQKAGA